MPRAAIPAERLKAEKECDSEVCFQALKKWAMQSKTTNLNELCKPLEEEWSWKKTPDWTQLNDFVPAAKAFVTVSPSLKPLHLDMTKAITKYSDQFCKLHNPLQDPPKLSGLIRMALMWFRVLPFDYERRQLAFRRVSGGKVVSF